MSEPITDARKTEVCDALDAFFEEHGEEGGKAIVRARPRDPRGDVIESLLTKQGTDMMSLFNEGTRVRDMPDDERGEVDHRFNQVLLRLKRIFAWPEEDGS